MATQLVVRIASPGVGRIETRVFTHSPVSVGSAASNLLRLEHPSVAATQGAIALSPTGVEYWEVAGGTGTRVGDIRPEAGEKVSLNEDTLVQIGPFRLCAELAGTAGRTEWDHPRRGSIGDSAFDLTTPSIVNAVASDSAGGLPRLETLTSFIYRALRLADVVSAVIVKLRAGCDLAGQRPFDTSPLRSSWNACEIAEYLLDTEASENRLVELERYLVELAGRAQVPTSRLIGRA